MNKFLLLTVTFLLFSCGASKIKSSEKQTPTTDGNVVEKTHFGASGMTQISDTSFIAVYDLKSDEKGKRFGIIKVSENTLDVVSLPLEGLENQGPPSDLESICAIPGMPNEYLACESGEWQGAPGRIFHIRLDLNRPVVTVLQTITLPTIHGNDFGKTGDQYEGIYCQVIAPDVYRVILAERGGSSVHPDGILRWGSWNVNSNTFQMGGQGLEGIAVSAPGKWSHPQTKRSLTDLYVDDNNNLWASASDDEGDLGTFYSVIYKVGMVNDASISNPVTVLSDLKVGKSIEAFKIESLAGPVKGIDCTHSFATEDEDYGGVWRPLRIE